MAGPSRKWRSLTAEGDGAVKAVQWLESIEQSRPALADRIYCWIVQRERSTGRVVKHVDVMEAIAFACAEESDFIPVDEKLWWRGFWGEKGTEALMARLRALDRDHPQVADRIERWVRERGSADIRETLEAITIAFGDQVP
jgi:hypothetical protein